MLRRAGYTALVRKPLKYSLSLAICSVLTYIHGVFTQRHLLLQVVKKKTALQLSPGVRRWQTLASKAAPFPSSRHTHTTRISDLPCVQFGGWIMALQGTTHSRNVTRRASDVWRLSSRWHGWRAEAKVPAQHRLGDAEMGCRKRGLYHAPLF